jgi:tetratricopeptide (TPR) repeat protein
MPFGKKRDQRGEEIDFDVIYEKLIRPAIKESGLEPLRADEERDGGIIHKPMFERLLLCQYAVADLTLANANVFYELGVRHSVRPHTTVLIYSPDAQRLPFDVAPLRAIPYGVAKGIPTDINKAKKELVERLLAAREPATDSPLVQLVDGYKPPQLDHLKTDVFRDRVQYSQGIKDRLSTAREHNSSLEIDQVLSDIDPLEGAEGGVLVDLILSYRAMSAWQSIIDLIARMPSPLRESVLVQEQLGLALNRAGRREDAIHCLEHVLELSGPSSETFGILGRVYKDYWLDAVNHGHISALAYLDKAIDIYRRGFEADWRDDYPGINLVTLLAIRNPNDDELGTILPVVKYACERRNATPDYWSQATLLELSVIEGDSTSAMRALSNALAEPSEAWQRASTASNLRLHLEGAIKMGKTMDWLQEIVRTLEDS